MAYAVTITSADGQKTQVHPCGGSSDQEALIYAGKVVEANAEGFEPSASVKVTRNDQEIGPSATVRDMTTKAS